MAINAKKAPAGEAEPNQPLQRLITLGLEQTGLKAAAAAKLVRLSPSLLSRALSGDRTLPRRKAVALADVLGLSRAEFLRAARHDGRADLDLPSVVLRRTAGLRLKVITDPQFLDSALFWWLFSKDPFISVNITCDLEKTPWGTVPAIVSSHDLAIGFYNKQVASHAIGSVSRYDIVQWADLTVYRGYALIGRPVKGAKNDHAKSIEEAERRIKRIIQQAKAEGRRPTIVTMEGDTALRLRTPLLEDVVIDDSTFEFVILPTADLALSRFRDGLGDCFIGGLPQRLLLREGGFPEILHFANNPFMASINSLLCSRIVHERHRNILHTALALWFETVHRMLNVEEYRKAVAKDVIALLDERGERHSLTPKLFDEVFGKGGREYEVFADGPGALVKPLLDTMMPVVGRYSQAHGLQEMFSYFHEAFAGKQKEETTTPV